MGNYNAKHHAYGIIVLIIALVVSVLVSSCATEKNFVKFHDRHDTVAIGHCAEWVPIKERIVQGKTIYRPGKTIKGKDVVIYADFDSAYQAAVKEAGKNGKVVIKKIAVKIPQSIRVDTIKIPEIHYQENTAKIIFMQSQLTAETQKSNKLSDSYHKWKKRALYEGGFIGVLALLTAFSVYRKISKYHRA